MASLNRKLSAEGNAAMIPLQYGQRPCPIGNGDPGRQRCWGLLLEWPVTFLKNGKLDPLAPNLFVGLGVAVLVIATAFLGSHRFNGAKNWARVLHVSDQWGSAAAIRLAGFTAHLAIVQKGC